MWYVVVLHTTGLFLLYAHVNAHISTVYTHIPSLYAHVPSLYTHTPWTYSYADIRTAEHMHYTCMHMHTLSHLTFLTSPRWCNGQWWPSLQLWVRMLLHLIGHSHHGSDSALPCLWGVVKGGGGCMLVAGVGHNVVRLRVNTLYYHMVFNCTHTTRQLYNHNHTPSLTVAQPDGTAACLDLHL